MTRKRSIRLVAMLVFANALLSLPKLVFAHPGHGSGLGGITAGLLANAALGSTGGCIFNNQQNRDD